MIRTAIILSSVTLFVAWYVHVVNRTAVGADFKRERLLKDVAFTAAVAGALDVLLVTWALVGVYVWHMRGRAVSIFVLGPPLLIWTTCILAAFAIGVALAEAYCVADERAFRRETERHLARAMREGVSHAQRDYQRARWWPASRELLTSGDPSETLVSEETPGVVAPISLMSPTDGRGLTIRR